MDDGSGNPSFAVWLYDRDGNEIASRPPVDPNAEAGTTGAFAEPREDSGIALGARRDSLNLRNFDGRITAVDIYNINVNSSVARQLASTMAGQFTSDAAAE